MSTFMNIFSHKAIYFAAIGTVSSCLSLSAIAEQNVSITPGIGYLSFDDDRGIASHSAPSIGIEYYITPNWSVGANYLESDTELEGSAANLDFSYTRLDGYYNFNPVYNIATPYLALGAGDSTFEFGSGNESDETLINFGGGVRFLLAEGLSVAADLRGINSIDQEKTSSLASLGFSLMLGGHSSNKSDSAESFEISQTEDLDNDGIINTLDQCPNTPSGVAVTSDGCGLDGDTDGVADYRDQCAETPNNISVDDNGCPLDIDQDGIADYQDDCNQTQPGMIVNANGCALSLSKNIAFGPSSASVSDELKAEIVELATFMQRYQNTVATIEGHADTSGSVEQNEQLSQARAEAVRDVLINEFGIDESRLKAVSYGQSRPLASNSTQDGREANRRVTAIITQQ